MDSEASKAVSKVASNMERLEGLFWEVTKTTSQLTRAATEFLQKNPNCANHDELASLVDKIFFEWHNAKKVLEKEAADLRALEDMTAKLESLLK